MQLENTTAARPLSEQLSMGLPAIRPSGVPTDPKSAAIEQWGSLAALKPELFVRALNPGTPASNADTPKAPTSPQRPAGAEAEGEAEESDAAACAPASAAVHDAQPVRVADRAAAAAQEAAPARTGTEAVKTELSAPPAPVPVQQRQQPLPPTQVNLEAAAAMAAAAMAAATAQEKQRAAEAEALQVQAQAMQAQLLQETRDAARKRKAKEMGLGELGEDELLAAEILSGSFLSGLPNCRSPPMSPDMIPMSSGALGGGAGGGQRKRGRQMSAKAAAAAAAATTLLEAPYGREFAAARKGGAGAARVRVAGGKQGLPKGSPVKAGAVAVRGKGGGGGKSGAGGEVTHTQSAEWVTKVMEFLESNGQNLLSSICAHYRIDYSPPDVSSIRDYSLEQIAHNAIFNPALPKVSGRMPKMLRDMHGVSNWKMTFLKDQAGIYRAVRVLARLGGDNFSAQCRCCSYCGSCFSGRFMKPNAMHQQAGGWKEITERTAAGKFSWASLRGWRLCVPCFTHWASNGTNVNANRPSVDDLMQEHTDILSCQTVSDEELHPKLLGGVVSSSPIGNVSWVPPAPSALNTTA